MVKLCGSLYERQPGVDWFEILFKEKSGKEHPPSINNCDPDFSLFYINRPQANIRKKAREVPINAYTNIRFQLRSLFGVGGKAEIILYLMTHEGARSKEIADDIGLFWLGVHQTLLNVSKSGLVLSRRKGKKVESWLSHKKWWEFISPASVNEQRPKWINWCSVFSALSILWTTIDEISQKDVSEYMKSSRLQDSIELVAEEFSRAGFDVGNPPVPGLTPELHQVATLTFLNSILGVKND